jgi:tRNA dimethylallyltransferase
LIETRIEQMMAEGWLEEVRSLMAAGYGDCHPMGALGYRHLRAHLQQKLDLEEAVRQTKRDTWRFAKRQLNWFSSNAAIEWYESTDAVNSNHVEAMLQHHGHQT